MVAYSFKPSFIEPIRAREKRQTIRLPRKRHAQPGEALQLFTGPRMRPTRLGGAICQRVAQVRLDFKRDLVTLDDAIEIAGDEALNTFAIRDGFRPWGAATRLQPWEFMGRWWSATHPENPVFAGVLVDWDETFAAFVPENSLPGELAA